MYMYVSMLSSPNKHYMLCKCIGSEQINTTKCMIGPHFYGLIMDYVKNCALAALQTWFPEGNFTPKRITCTFKTTGIHKNED